MSCQWQLQQLHSRWEGNIADKLAIARYDQQAFPRPLLSDQQWNFNHQRWMLSSISCTDNESVLLTHIHTPAGIECRLYSGDSPNVPCSARLLVFMPHWKSQLICISRHTVAMTLGQEGAPQSSRLGHVTLVPIYLRPFN